MKSDKDAQDKQHTSHTRVINTDYDTQILGYTPVIGLSEQYQHKAQWWAFTTVTGHATLFTTWLLTLPIIILPKKKRKKVLLTYLSICVRGGDVEKMERGGMFYLLRPPRPRLPMTRLERGICSAASHIFSRGSPQYIFITTVICSCFTTTTTVHLHLTETMDCSYNY